MNAKGSKDSYTIELLSDTFSATNSIPSIPYMLTKDSVFTIDMQGIKQVNNLSLYAYNNTNTNLSADKFEISSDNEQITIIAKEDVDVSSLGIQIQTTQASTDAIISVKNPIIENGKSIDMINSPDTPSGSVLFPDNAGTAWGNSNEASENPQIAKVHIDGSVSNKLENVSIEVTHDSFFSLRVPDFLGGYRIHKNYEVDSSDPVKTIINFTTPVSTGINIPIVFNYVPDGLAKDIQIPTDAKATIRVLISDNEVMAATNVTTSYKEREYSEAPLQSKGEKFLVNARNDTYESLITKVRVPSLDNSGLRFRIYDISNDQVTSISNKNWYSTSEAKEIKENSEGFPIVTKDDNDYTFDFGHTSKRYVIVFEKTNGWAIGQKKIIGSVNGGTDVEAVLPSGGASFLDSIVLNQDLERPNIVHHTLKTKLIDNDRFSLQSPSFDFSLQGTSRMNLDQFSLSITTQSGKLIPSNNYRVDYNSTDQIFKIIFSEQYVLKENIIINFDTISNLSGTIMTTVKGHSNSFNQEDISDLRLQSNVVNARYAEGTGVAPLVGGSVNSKNSITNEYVGNVTFSLRELGSDKELNFSTGENGSNSIEGLYPKTYIITVKDIPKRYTLDDGEYLTGKEITLSSEASRNQIDILLTPKESQESIFVKNSIIYTNDSWEPKDNFLSATDFDGISIPFSDKIKTEGIVNTKEIGTYKVRYFNEETFADATIIVKENKQSIKGSDYTMYVGDKEATSEDFKPVATDKDGNKVDVTADLSNIDFSKVGSYDVVLTSSDGQSTNVKLMIKENKQSILFGNNKDKENNSSNITQIVKINNDNTTKKAKQYPLTGAKKENLFSTWGLLIIIMTIGIYWFCCKVKKIK